MYDRMSPEDRAEALAVIARQALRVSRMLDDMMDSARAEVGVLGTDDHTAVSLDHTVREAVLVCTPEEQERLQIEVDTNVTVRGNSSQLSRVIQNLVVNALHHAPHDTTVQVRAYGTHDEGVIVVTDHGPGVPDGVHLFDRYSRGPSGGTGLGLFTASQIVGLHQGRIEVDATPGGGATFLVRIPLEESLDNGVAP
jgi:two-component system OmpR family sensor kinase